MRLPNLLATRLGRLTAFFFLYITEGIPLGFAATAVATQLRRQDVGPAEIGAFVGSFYLPWAFKWAFGPFVDVFTSERLGKRRGWILGTQVMLIAHAAGLHRAGPAGPAGPADRCAAHPQQLRRDAGRGDRRAGRDTLRADERGLANGVMFAGAAIGTAIGGSGVLFLMPLIGLQGGFVFVAACIAAVTVFIVLPLQEPTTPQADRRVAGLASAARQMRQFSMEAFRSFLGTRGAFAGAVLRAAAGRCDEPRAGAAIEPGGRGRHERRQRGAGWRCGPTSSAPAPWCSAGCCPTASAAGARWRLPRADEPAGALADVACCIEHQWIMPWQQSGADRRVAPAALVTAIWTADAALRGGDGPDVRHALGDLHGRHQPGAWRRPSSPPTWR